MTENKEKHNMFPLTVNLDGKVLKLNNHIQDKPAADWCQIWGAKSLTWSENKSDEPSFKFNMEGSPLQNHA